MVAFLIWPQVVKTTFKLFACEEVYGPSTTLYLTQNLEQPCFDARHTTVSASVGLLLLLVFLVGFPALIIFLVSRDKEQWGETRSKAFDVNFGFLVAGLRPGFRKYVDEKEEEGEETGRQTDRQRGQRDWFLLLCACVHCSRAASNLKMHVAPPGVSRGLCVWVAMHHV